MRVVYTPQMKKIIYEHEEKMYNLYSQITTEYSLDFAQYGCTVELGYEWRYFLKKGFYKKRIPFKNGYEYVIYFEIVKDGNIVGFDDGDGEPYDYRMVGSWVVSSISRCWFRLIVDLYDDISDVKEYLDQYLSILKQNL